MLATALESIQSLQFVNESKYFWGIAMLTLNLGSRFIASDLSDFHQRVLTNDLVKKFILFSMFFVATRDVATSFVLTIVFTIVVYGIFNEHSRYSLVQHETAIRKKLHDYYHVS